MRRDTLVDFFDDLIAIRGDFLVYDDGYKRRVHTYEEVGRAARGFAARLSAAGIRQGDTVILWGENRPEWIVCYWGCLIAGIVIVPIDYRSSPEFVRKVAGIVDARLAVLGDDVTPLGDDGPLVRWRLGDLDWRADGPMPTVSISRDDVTQIIFTSGATAEPKGVVIRHRNVLANIIPVEREILKYRKYARPFSPLRFVNLLPLSHMFGQAMATNVPPMLRGTVIFTRSFNPHDIIHLIKSRRVSVLVCVPKILDVLREHVTRAFPETQEAPPAGISIPGRWWRYRRVHSALGMKFWAFVVGAAPLPPDLEEFWRRMGFAVVQGYGLTETAPIVTLNHPFRTSKGSVGKPIAGVDIKIADDGEILVRGENVTSGYYENPKTQLPTTNHQLPTVFDAEGWFHTGDIGGLDEQGRLFIRGRKKEMIVTPEGLNVFPEDVERVVNDVAGVKESAVVGVAEGAQERVHAVVVLEAGADADAVVREANARLQDHQRIRTISVWPGTDLPRTEGTRKLKRAAIRQWVMAGGQPLAAPTGDSVESLIARFARGRKVSSATTLEELGLTSLERVELMVALEDRFQTRVDESKFSEAASISDLRQLIEEPAAEPADEAHDFPTWNRKAPVRLIRRLSQATWIVPLTQLFSYARVEGLSNLSDIDGPVVFASNHQSHMDVPVILSALPGRWRSRLAPAMLKEFFAAHFHPEGHTWRQRFTNSLNYYLACFYFNTFPIPQREAGARHTLQYIGELTGDGFSILLFPEGVRSTTGTIKPFRGGIGMIASRLELPVVPVRIDDVDRLMPIGAKFIRPGRIRVAFGAPLKLRGDDYAGLATQVEEAVRRL